MRTFGDERDLVAGGGGTRVRACAGLIATWPLSTCRWQRGCVSAATHAVGLAGGVAQPARVSRTEPERTGAANVPVPFGGGGCLMAVAGSGTVAPEAEL